jgi:uncharacterized membrane protein
MNEQGLSGISSIPPPLRPLGRALASGVVGSICFVVGAWLPQETRIILSIDVFLFTYVALVYRLMSVATAERCVDLARGRRTLAKEAMLIATLLVTSVSIAAIGVMLNSQRDQTRWVRLLHLGSSLFALIVGWICAQMIFAVQYMRIYYGDAQDGGALRTTRDLNFPGQAAPDLWDFMYFSFTVAMCYGTTDVAISSKAVRRLALVHAVYSFFFVATIIGFMVSVLSTVG